MTSVTRFLKQIPSDTPYFVPLSNSACLNYWTPDANASITSYASGQAAGQFTSSTITVQKIHADTGCASTLTVFRDMGVTIVSSGRTFRRVQLLQLDGNGQSQWPTTGGWQPSNEGVTGTVNTAPNTADASYNVYYFEAGWRGLGIAQGLIRYG